MDIKMVGGLENNKRGSKRERGVYGDGLSGNVDLRPVVLFFVLTFVVSFGWAFMIYFLPEIYYAQNYQTMVGILAILFVNVQVFGPSISAIMVTGFFEGKEGLKQFLSSLLRFRVKFYWYLFVFFLPVFVYSVPILLDIALGNPSNHDYFNVSLWGISSSAVFLNVFFAAFAEEPGWRGYALPKMNSRFRPIVSGVVIGVVWAFWHLLFYVFGARPWSNFPQFVFTVTTISCIYTWVYMKTRSIPLMMIFHVMHNLSNTVFIKYQNPLWGGIVYFAFLVAILIADRETVCAKN